MKNRPNPDKLLDFIEAEEKKNKRGKLKIFFGCIAGVGKTYDMLLAGHQKLQENFDVVIGVIETHKRVATEKLVLGLEQIPSLELNHNGILIKEFNLDAAKKRNPDIILIDEMAHSNAAGTRHSKRWQDIEELLNHGIDVYTTLNVQHLESLNDIVTQITTIAVKETIPDEIFDKADDIVIVDITPDELLKRLKDGQVYLDFEVKDLAAKNFFKKDNIAALRELALRRTAERVENQRYYNQIYQDANFTLPLAEKIMVCVGSDALSARLVRSTKRMANTIKADWIAVYVETARHYQLNEKGKKIVDSVFNLAQRMGGKTMILQGNNAVEEIMSYARSNRITKIIVGKTNKPYWQELIYGNLANKIIAKSGNNIDVYVITGEKNENRYFKKINRLIHFKPSLYINSLIAVFLFTIFNKLADPILVPIDQMMIYLIGTILIAARLGRGPSIVYSLLSVTFFNFFFIPPLYSFNVYDQSYWITFLVMLFTAFVITHQASRLRLQSIFSRKRERSAQIFYEIARKIASTRGHKNIAKIVAQKVEELFSAQVVIWLKDEKEKNEILIIHGHPPLQDEKEKSVITWCFENKENAGSQTNTMPSAKGFYLPLIATSGAVGVMAIFAKDKEINFNKEESLLETISHLLALGLERASNADFAEKSKVEIESEKLRNVLLSSISHDLRTPLASIIGSASSMVLDGNKLSKENIKELAGSINNEAQRLSRIVTNLLNISKIEAKNSAIAKQGHFLEELIGTVLNNLNNVLKDHKIKTEIAKNLPMVFINDVLIEQLLINLLENAVKYSNKGSTIKIAIDKKEDYLLIKIEDEGIGIPAGNEKKIFEKFYTSDVKRGAGLGLAICQAVVKEHNGEIWVENKKDKGCIFYFTLPILKNL